MAYHKVGDRLLSSEEFDQDSVEKWGLALFILIAFFVGAVLHSLLPVEWPKFVRFPLLMVTGAVAGVVAAYFARIIRNLFLWIIRLGIVSSMGYGVWTII